MTHCTVCFHNILWFHLKACIKNCGFLFRTINIRKIWSHHKSTEMKCNKVSKDIKWENLAHTFIFPSLFFIVSGLPLLPWKRYWGTTEVLWDVFQSPKPTSLAESMASGNSLTPGQKLVIAGKCVQEHLHQPLGSSTSHLLPSWILTVQLLKPQIL